MISDNHKSASIELSGLVVLVCDGWERPTVRWGRESDTIERNDKNDKQS